MAMAEPTANRLPTCTKHKYSNFHLYKTQVFQLAEYLGVPGEICRRIPTTDTYPDEQTQEEFFFGLKFKTMDLLWYALENNVPVEEVSRVMELSPERMPPLHA